MFIVLTIREAANSARVSKEKARYWLKLMQIDLVKQDGKLYLADNAADLLQEMKKAIESGLTPAAAAVDVKNTYPLPGVPADNSNQVNDNQVLQKIADLEASILFLAETVKGQNRVIESQSAKIAALVATLPAPECKSIPRVKVWQPEPRQAPQVSFLRRLWLQLFSPERLRAAP